MNEVSRLINQIRDIWKKPKQGIHQGEKTYFNLSCTLSEESEVISDDYLFNIPQDLKSFWSYTREATLFLDEKYGQWGLKILSPSDALLYTNEEKQMRPDEYERSELVIGSFIGDADKLVVDCSLKNSGKITISSPLDPSKDWPVVASSFLIFLNNYVESDGEKFWE